MEKKMVCRCKTKTTLGEGQRHHSQFLFSVVKLIFSSVLACLFVEVHSKKVKKNVSMLNVTTKKITPMLIKPHAWNW